MAERRMLSKKIINSARFLKMPISTQALYFHLVLHADDDGIVEAWNVMQITGAGEDDLRLLHAKGFVVILNEDLVSYINDWTEHNKIRADRKIDSIYQPLLLRIVPDVKLLEPRPRADSASQRTSNGQPTDVQRTTNGQPTDVQRTTNGQHRLGKDRLGEDRLDNKTICAIPCGNAHDLDAKSDTKKDLQEQRFNEFWSIYPKKVGKEAAKKAWKKVKPDKDLFDKIIKAINTAKTSEQWRKNNGQFIPNPATWLNQGRWDDEIDAVTVEKVYKHNKEPEEGSTKKRMTPEEAEKFHQRLMQELEEGRVKWREQQKAREVM